MTHKFEGTGLVCSHVVGWGDGWLGPYAQLCNRHPRHSVHRRWWWRWLRIRPAPTRITASNVRSALQIEEAGDARVQL